jgi:hypothetical protein
LSLIDVDFYERKATLVFIGEPLKGRAEGATGCAPLRPTIHEHRGVLATLNHLLGEGVIISVKHKGREVMWRRRGGVLIKHKGAPKARRKGWRALLCLSTPSRSARGHVRLTLKRGEGSVGAIFLKGVLR